MWLIKGPDSSDEKKECLLSNFLGRQTTIVAYGGAVCNQKESPGVQSRDKKNISLDKVISFLFFSKIDGQTFWLIELLNAFKRDLKGRLYAKKTRA